MTPTQPATPTDRGPGPSSDAPDVLARLRNWEAKTASVGRETVHARLDVWQARIDALRIQAHLAGLDSRDAAPLARMAAKMDDARQRLQELAQESEDVWTVLFEGYESARAELASAAELVEERVGH
jgi:hypothetical protein